MPFIGQYAFLQLQKYVVKRTMDIRMEKSSDKMDLIHFKFVSNDLEELSWEHAREFERAGQMFDVIEECQIGDTTHMWCWADHQETILGIRLKQLFKQLSPHENPSDRPMSNPVIDWHKVKYVTLETIWENESPDEILSTWSSDTFEEPTPIYLEVLAPPPEA